MKKNGKDACDYCGRTFRKTTRYVKYTDGSCYHHECLKKVGGRNDLGRNYEQPKSTPVQGSSFNAGEILRQLGGNKFIAMTGAKQFVRDDNKKQITFKIGRNSRSINYVKIRLNSMDTYDMHFYRIRGVKITQVSQETGVYGDQLQNVFTAHTGMNTRLF